MSFVDTAMSSSEQASEQASDELRGFAPFPPAVLARPDADRPASAAPAPSPVNPFRMSGGRHSEADTTADAVETFLTEVANEDFDHALHPIVDEVAALEMRADAESGSVTPGAAQWIERLASHTEAAIDSMAAQLESLDLAAVGADELESTLQQVEIGSSPASELEEQFIRGVLRAAKKGLAQAGRLLPFGALVGRFRAIIRPFQQGLLSKGLGTLPDAVQPLAGGATRFGTPPSQHLKAIKAELKKRCISIVTRQRYESFDVIEDDDPPYFDFDVGLSTLQIASPALGGRSVSWF